MMHTYICLYIDITMYKQCRIQGISRILDVQAVVPAFLWELRVYLQLWSRHTAGTPWGPRAQGTYDDPLKGSVKGDVGPTIHDFGAQNFGKSI